MREIKFRVRSCETNKIIGFEWVSEDGEWKNNVSFTGIIFGNYQVDREQFIGIRENWSDNGIEVYHKDILEANWREDNDLKKPQTLEVTFLNGCFMIGTCNIHEFFRIYCSAFKVIGNQPENPELLEDVDK